MTFEGIRQAIEGRMAEWDSVPVAYDGVPVPDPVNGVKSDLQKAQDEGRSWVRLTIQHGNSLVASISDRPETRRPGLVMLQIFAPLDEGSRPAALLADSLANHFEYWRDGHLTTTTASVQRVGPSDGWYQYNVSVPFSAGC